MEQENYSTDEREFQITHLYYKIYRHISAILLLIAQMHTGKTYGRGWKPFYEYSKRNNDDTDEYS